MNFPIVGMHFRPPAKVVLNYLPSGAKLVLVPDPENVYDELAVQVWVSPTEMVKGRDEEIEENLEGYGITLSELYSQSDPLFLGFICKTSPKQIVGNVEFWSKLGGHELGLAQKQVEDLEAKLGFSPSGTPLACVNFPVF